MASFTRRNAWNNGGTFANPDLLWYAKGVGVMQALALDNPNSWWFFSAIHGQSITTATDTGVNDWAGIPAPPQVPIGQLPSAALIAEYWDQCQHRTWYFPPWHRGYLIALEAQIRAAVVSLGGPSDWALPYWNYLGPDTQYEIPPAFTKQTLPDNTPNPLFVKSRHGPNFDDVIFVEIGFPNGANEQCQSNTGYTDEYGGPETGFWHGDGGGDFGNLEANPHGNVHVDVGGLRENFAFLFSVDRNLSVELDAMQLSAALSASFQAQGILLSLQARVAVGAAGIFWVIIDGSEKYFIAIPDDVTLNILDVFNPPQLGLMTDPDTAALDPIFYLHHANIDRMWAKWNEMGNSNPPDQNWLKGPTAVGDRKFAMPMPLPAASPWRYAPEDVNSLSQLDYTYDDMPVTVSSQPALIVAQRLMKLGVAPAAARAVQGGNMDGGENAELLGANDEVLQIKSSGARATVTLDNEVRGRVFASLAAASATNVPDRVYLRLENVRGNIDAYKLNVSVNQKNVGNAALFGLRKASLADGQHGGAGLNFKFDITEIIDSLFLANTLDVDSLDVKIDPNAAVPAFAQLTIGRVSVYRQGVQG